MDPTDDLSALARRRKTRRLSVSQHLLVLALIAAGFVTCALLLQR